MKRFYREAGVGEADGRYRVLLDGKPMRTPKRQLLELPSAALAKAIAAEWQAQGETVEPACMHLTRLATSVVDLLPERRQPAIEQLLDYVGTDLLTYRASGPAELVDRQRTAWQPPLDWLARTHEVTLPVQEGVLPLEPPAGAKERLGRVIERLDDWRLVALHTATCLTGSLVLGLALLAGRLDATALTGAALLDERFAIERWGEDAEVTRRHRAIAAELDAVECFLAAL